MKTLTACAILSIATCSLLLAGCKSKLNAIKTTASVAGTTVNLMDQPR